MKFQDIIIKAKANGVEVKVGCMELVYNDMKMFFKDLKNYLNNPEETEKEIRKRWKIKELGGVVATWERGDAVYLNTDSGLLSGE